MSRLVLDLTAFKALANETRLDMLTALEKREASVSELARRFDIPHARAHEHLGILLSAGLVKRHEDHRRRVSYRLTWKGLTLLSPERKQVAVFLGFAGGLLVAGFAYALEVLLTLATSPHAPQAGPDVFGFGVQAVEAVPLLPAGGLIAVGALLASSAFVSLLAWDAWRRRAASPLDEFRDALRS